MKGLILLNDTISMFLTILAFPLFFGSLAFIGYVMDEQSHRHKLELEKAKQGIFDKPNSSIESHLEKILISVVILAIVVIICYALNIPSNFLEYVLSVLK